MSCASCGRANPDGARFCGGCGGLLAPRCAACGAECAADARFCTACGAPVEGRPSEVASARKVVTIVFADLIGSVSLHERLDAESARRFMDRYHRTMSAAVQVHGGRVIQLLGDGVLAAFGVPRVAEDDAIRAVRAAVGMQRAFRELSREQSGATAGVGLRVAVNTGEIVVGDDASSVMGDPTNVAARLQHEARDGDVIVGEGTQRLVGALVTLAPLGSYALRGRSESVAAFRVVSLDRPATAPTTAFVGRDEELRRLVAVYEAAVAASAAKLAVLLGSPGLGKSRLLAELAGRIGARATVLSARCDAAGGATFAPLADALRALLHIDEGAGSDDLRAAIDAVVPGAESERVRVAAGIGALLSGAPASPEETFFVVRRLLAALAGVRPVLLVFDDLHWAEPLLLDLVEHLVQWSSGVPLLVLVAARPELRDARSSLTVPGGLVAEVVTLTGLDAGAAMQLAARVIGATELPAALVGRVLATSEGNPLFVAELVRMLVQDGTLRREGERWVTTVELAKLDMPPTIQVLLAARIERLRPEERSVLERAAVIGRQFSRGAVAHLLPASVADLDARLEALRRSELIEPDTTWFLGEPALRFHHVLIRDAAYRRVLKETRADLHERLADWIAARSGDASEPDETLGWHLEQAHRHLAELGPLDARGRELGARAARHLGAAGRRALARDDLSLAAGLFERALGCLDPSDAARPDFALDWCEALLAAGDVVPASRAIAELERFVAGSDRLAAWHACFEAQRAVLTDPTALRASADAMESAAARLTAAGDAAGEAKAHAVHAQVLAQLGKIGACEAALDRALAAARRARDRRRANAVLAGAPIAALWGPSPVTRASGRCLDVVRVLRITQGAPAVEAVALRCQAVLETLRGRADAARRMIAASRAMVEELGITQRVLEADLFAGLIELLEGDASAAEGFLRTAWDGLRQQGLGIDAAQAGALLARALLALGRGDEAEALSVESEALAGDSFKAAIAWRCVRAEALAARGERESAVEIARAAVEIAAATDDLLDHADARSALAVALRAAGRAAEAAAEEQRAIELWETKGATLLVERARSSRPQPTLAPTDRAAPTAPVRRRVRENAAIANDRAVDAAVAARDVQAFERLVADDATSLDHTTGTLLDRRQMLQSWRSFLAADGFAAVSEPLATLGDALALFRQSMAAGGVAAGDLDVGPYESTAIRLSEVDGEGRRRRTEFFAPRNLGDAVVRLYERYAELVPDDAERSRAAVRARTIAAQLGPFDPQLEPGALAPGVELVDRRRVGFGERKGPEAFLRGVETVSETGSDIAVCLDELLAASPNALLVRWTTAGTDRRHGGRFEWCFLRLLAFDADGLLDRYELFEPDAAEAALARFDAIAGAAHESPFANAAWRAQLAFERAWRERRFGDVLAFYHSGCVLDDRRSIVGVTLEGRDFRENVRLLFEGPGSRWETRLIATRGERLTLCGAVYTAGRVDGGRIESEHIAVQEHDADGRATAIVIFDVEDLDAAYAELDARFLAGEGAPFRALLDHLRTFDGATGAPDPEALQGVVPADFVVRSHRRFSDIGERFGRDEYLASMAAIRGMGARGRLRTNHLRISSRVAIADSTWSGARDGGAFEIPSVAVFAHDGRVVRSLEMYDAEQVWEAFARYEAIGREPTSRFTNAAWRTAEQAADAWRRSSIEALDALLAPGVRFFDRRSLLAAELDRAGFLASYAPMMADFDHFDVTNELLATRGDSLVLCRRLDLGHRDDGRGAVEVELLLLLEIDERALLTSLALFDPNDLDAAYAELDARHRAGEAAPHASVAAGMREFTRAFVARDWDALAARCADDIEIHDRRRLGWEPLHGPAAYVEALRALVELAPDTSLRLDHVETSERGYLVLTVWAGTREGGAFEEPSWMVAELDAAGRIRRFDQYDLDRLDAARARFAEIGASRAEREAPSAVRIPPNAATHASDLLGRARDAQDWDAFRDLCAPTLVFDDRRRSIQLRGDRDLFVASARVVSTYEARISVTLLATSGDRLALRHMHVAGTPDGASSEAEWLSLLEVDAQGRIVTLVAFDPEDRRAASREMADRFAGTGDTPSATGRGAWRRFFDHDVAGFREEIPDDFYIDDHRRFGLGRVDGAAPFLESVSALFDRSRDLAVERLYIVATAAHAFLDVARMFGTLVASGGPFEMVYVRLVAFRDDRFAAIELFDFDDLDAARARFEALRFDPLRIPPNAATRAGEEFRERVLAGDWDGVRALCAPTYRFEDRRRLVRTEGDRETLVANARHISRSVWERATRTLLATNGDRLALHRACWSGDGSAAFEIEVLEITEVDASGRFVASIVLDADERRAAAIEMLERYGRGEGASRMPPSQVELVRAMNARDLEGVRAALDEEFRFVDHRRTGVGEVIGADAYVRSVAVIHEQSDDLATDVLYHVEHADHGSISVGRMFGTWRDGGPFESVFVRLNRYESGRSIGTEIFEIDDLERAKRRFAELGAAYAARRPDSVPPNGATRAFERVARAFVARDWDGLRAFAAPDFAFEDRRRRALVAGDIETWIRNLEAVSEWAVGRRHSTPLAALGERIALIELEYAGGPGGAAFEGRFLRLVEIDANGALRAVLHFDVEDRRAAFVEAYRRFAAGEGGDTPAQHAMSEIGSALAARDWEALRASLVETTVIRDHRAIVGTAVGDLDRDAWIAALDQGLVSEYSTEAFRFPAWHHSGRLWVARTFGTTRDGGPFESLFVGLFQTDGARLTHLEIFDIEDFDRALARFEELRARGSEDPVA